MSAIVEAVSPSRDALPVCLWREKPNRLVSLGEMRFEAVRAIKVLESLAKLEMTSLLGRDIPSPTFYETCASICEDLVPILRDLGLVRQAVTTSELASFMRSHETLPDSDRLSKLSLLIHHDLDGFVFEAIPKSRAEYYE